MQMNKTSTVREKNNFISRRRQSIGNTIESRQKTTRNKRKPFTTPHYCLTTYQSNSSSTAAHQSFLFRNAYSKKELRLNHSKPPIET